MNPTPPRPRRCARIAARCALSLIGPLATLALAAAPASAQRVGADPSVGAPLFERDGAPVDPDDLPLVGSFAEVEIAGDVAHVTLVQLYQNRRAEPLEATYVFPGSTRAAVTGMTMTLGDRVITAHIRERAEARQEYEEARDEGKAAALLEQHRANVLRMNVANILPGEVVQVEIEYVERLLAEDGSYELVIPAVVAPRYAGPQGDAVGRVVAPTPPVRHLPIGVPWRLMRGISVDLTAALPLVEVSSPSHPVAPLPRDGAFYSHRHTELDEPPRDFVLRYRLAGDDVGAGVMLYERDGEGWFMATLEPPARVEAREVLPREFVFLLDVSGSMNGWPMETSKDLITELLAALRPTDRFNVIAFAGGSQLLSPRSLPATPANTRGIAARVDAIASGGGTDLGGALNTGFDLPATPGFTRTFVVISDGMIWASADVYRLIRERLGDANVFAFGVHRNPDRDTLERIARAGQGEPIIVVDEADAHEAVARFVAYVSSPILTDLSVTVEGLDAFDVLPTALPDLFAQRPLVVTGRYRGAASGVVRVRGRAADGPFEAVVDLGAATPDPRHAAIATLWARERARDLGDALAMGEDVKGELVALGLAHRLLTEHTSFVAVDERVRTDGSPPHTVEHPASPGHGADGVNAALGAAMGATGFGSGQGGGGMGFSGMGVGGSGAVDSGGGLGFGGPGTGGSGYGVGRIHGTGAATAGDRRAATPVPALPVVVLTGFVGGLAEGPALAAMRRRARALGVCQQRRLVDLPTLAGTLRLRVSVEPDGHVASVRLVGDGLDDDLDRCVVRVLRRVRFVAPEPAVGSAFELTVTFSRPPR